MQASKPGKPAVRGLYAITPNENDTRRLCAMVEASIAGGASLVQYRNKLADTTLALEQSRALLEICRQHQVPLIINDDVELCMAIDADGVHIGASDGNLAKIRSRIGAEKLLGASCYNNPDLASKAQALGADYVAFGACFASGTKPNAPRADLSLFDRERGNLNIPKVAIGGITLANAKLALEAGADAVAVIGAVFSAEDIEDTSRQFSRLYQA